MFNDERQKMLLELKKEFCPKGVCQIAWPVKCNYYEEEIYFENNIYNKQWDQITPSITSLHYDLVFFVDKTLFLYCLAVYVKSSLEMELLTENQMEAIIYGIPIYSIVVLSMVYPNKKRIGEYESSIEAKYGYGEIYTQDKYEKELKTFNERFGNMSLGQANILAKYLLHLYESNFGEQGDKAKKNIDEYWGNYL